jgi:glycosyltransferase involved in cell wall biosynthesis
MTRLRLTIVETHPIQYNAPWFRYITAECPEIDLTVVYASQPSAAQQAIGYDASFTWDSNLLDGYRATVVRQSRPDESFDSEQFGGLDVAEIGDAVLQTRPDVAMIAGWHSASQHRAMRACRAHRIPVLYRGDTHLGMAPAGLLSLAWRAKARAMLSRYSGYLAVGSRAREYMLANGVAASRIFASPHAVDNAFFAAQAEPYLCPSGRAAARGELGIDADDFVVLFVGRLNSRKRVGDALEAVARLGSRATLIVAGNGAALEERQADARRRGARAVWAGFVNQRDLGKLYAAADCLVLPSGRESWGLVANEALATGLPVVVSRSSGCAADLVVAGETGETFRAGDVADLTSALARVRERGGRLTMASACRAHIARSSYAAASVGLVAAAESLAARRSPRVIACCGGMVMVSGLERMTFEVLRVVRRHGATVHCIVNGWENHRIVPLANAIGASWSTGYYGQSFSWRAKNPISHLKSLWDVARTSAGLLRDAIRFRPTHVLVPEYLAVLRNAPALAVLRLLGVDIVFRIGNAPERGAVYEILWRRLLPPFVTTFVPNSRFGYARLQDTGVPQQKITLIRNALSRRSVLEGTDEEIVRLASKRRTLLTAGQIAPFKGTHLAVDAALELIAAGHDVQAIIAGAIPIWPPDLVDYVAELRARVDGAGAADRIHFVGGRENLPAIMRASWLLVAPILQEETFGNVLLEARSEGLPVVTFDRGALGELVTHKETGYICATSDLTGLREGIRYFLDHPDERSRASANSLAASARPDEECTPAEFERRWWALFERAS